jgi:hypothetical protein
VILTRLARVVRAQTAVVVAPDLPKLFPKPATMTGTEERERIDYKGDATTFQAEYTGSTIHIRTSWPRDLGPMTDVLGDTASSVGNQYVYEKTFEDIEAFSPARKKIETLFQRITRS